MMKLILLLSFLSLAFAFRSSSLVRNQRKFSQLKVEKKDEGMDLDLEQMFEVFEAAEKGKGDIGDLKLSPQEEEAQRTGISTSMRDKLLREAASNDPNFSAGPILGNPIVLISAIIGVLVIVGGKGYFY